MSGFVLYVLMYLACFREMFSEAFRLVGRYECAGERGQAIHVAMTNNIYCRGQNPFEVTVLRYGDKSQQILTAAQRTVLDIIKVDNAGKGIAQGQAIGLHGEAGFRKKSIKDMQLEIKPFEFTTAQGQPLLNATIIIKEYRYLSHFCDKTRSHYFFRFPESQSELANLTPADKLVATSEYCFSGCQGSLKLSLKVWTRFGATENVELNQMDKIDRRYSVTTHPESRYFIKYSSSYLI